MRRRLAAEGLGSLLLAATVIGSGVMAEQLAGGNVAIALLANTLATVLVLAVLIGLLGPISGAHLNPAVSLLQVLRSRMPLREAAAYMLVQIAGCCAGAVLAHAMFTLPLVSLSLNARSGAGQWLGEFVATLGLLLIVAGHRRAADAPWMVAAWIGAAYWFTSSTSFANPAITLARALSNTFAGIEPAHVPAFIAAQMAAVLVVVPVARGIFGADAGVDQITPRSASETVSGPATIK